jgi:hypothetical protein
MPNPDESRINQLWLLRECQEEKNAARAVVIKAERAAAARWRTCGPGQSCPLYERLVTLPAGCSRTRRRRGTSTPATPPAARVPRRPRGHTTRPPHGATSARHRHPSW